MLSMRNMLTWFCCACRVTSDTQSAINVILMFEVSIRGQGCSISYRLYSHISFPHGLSSTWHPIADIGAPRLPN